MKERYAAFLHEQDFFKKEAIKQYRNICKKNNTKPLPISNVIFHNDHIFVCTDIEELDGMEISVEYFTSNISAEEVENNGSC